MFHLVRYLNTESRRGQGERRRREEEVKKWGRAEEEGEEIGREEEERERERVKGERKGGYDKGWMDGETAWCVATYVFGQV